MPLGGQGTGKERINMKNLERLIGKTVSCDLGGVDEGKIISIVSEERDIIEVAWKSGGC